MLAPNWITVKHHQTIKSWITIQWFSLDFARTDPFEVLIADVSQTPTVLWTVGLPLISASFHHTALSHVSWITWIRGNVTLEFSFCTTEMVEISCPYHPCDQCPGAFQQGGSNAPERQCNSQRPPEAKVSPVFPVSPVVSIRCLKFCIWGQSQGRLSLSRCKPTLETWWNISQYVIP